MIRASAAGQRPPSAYSRQKIGRILESARTLFARHGYGATSMDTVAADANVGKATVYAHFRSKAELFAAVIADEGQTHLVSLEARADEPVEAVLHRFGREAFTLLLTPNTTSFLRMIVAEAPRFPELGEIFYQTGPAQLQIELATFLARAMDRGWLRREEPRIAACHFLALISGDLQLQELVGVGASTSGEVREQVLQSGVAAFLRAYLLPERPKKD